MNTLYGFKMGQEMAFDEAGQRVPVTNIRLEPNIIVGQKTREKDGYDAFQVALGQKKHPAKPLQGLLKNLSTFANASADKSQKVFPQFIKEVKLDKLDQLDKFAAGTKISVADVFSAGDKIKVTGISKGKGFAGVVKRHHFKGGPKTHGQSDRQRHPGSIGQTTTPGRVYKGKRMAGHMGNVAATVKNLTVFAVRPEENLLLVRGLIPGAKGGLVKITKLLK